MGKFRRSCVITAFAVVSMALSHAAAFEGAVAEVRNLGQPGAFAIEASPSGASLEKQGRIEQHTAAGWKPVFDGFSLVVDCDAATALPACVRLAPGAVLRPVPWNGYTCSGQCPRSCKKNVYRPPGTFRLVLTVCGEDARVVGAPFVMTKAKP